MSLRRVRVGRPWGLAVELTSAEIIPLGTSLVFQCLSPCRGEQGNRVWPQRAEDAYARMLNRFSRVQHFATLWTVACQASPGKNTNVGCRFFL